MVEVKAAMDFRSMQAMIGHVLDVMPAGKDCTLAHLLGRGGSGGSIPGNRVIIQQRDYENSAYVKAIHALPEPFPEIIRGSCAPKPTITEIAAITKPILATYRETAAMIRAGEMLAFILRPWDYENAGPKPKICEVYGIAKEDWQDSKERKAWDEVNRKLRAQLKPAFDAWVAECERRGLEL